MSPDDYRAASGYRRSQAGSAGPVVSRPSGGPVQSAALGDMTSADLAAFMRGEFGEGSARINAKTVLRNPAVARSVFVISNTIGALPFHLMQEGHNSGDLRKAVDNPLYNVLARRPNGWQTAFTFRRLMQHRALVQGNAYALPIRSRGAVRELIPLDPRRVQPKQRDDWSVYYEVQRQTGGITTVERADMMHIMGPSECGLKGMSLVEYAGEVLGLAAAAQRAAAKVFRQGVLAGGALSTEQKLSPEAIERLKNSLSEEWAGDDQAGKWMVLEQGLTAKPFGTNKDTQNVEQRKLQIEEVARIFGVPRPFLMLDDTSWGSGIEQLGIFFIQYGLMPWFVAWEQEVERILLSDADVRQGHYTKFNERALLRGSMKDQAEYFSKALGSGGAPAWMTQDEVRDVADLGRRGGDADLLNMGMAASAPGGN
jgi:HK97 family phage portal protein